MKKCIAFLLALAVIIGLSACKTAPQQNATENTETATTEATSVPTEVTAAPTETPTAETDKTATVAPTDVTVETTVTTEATTAPTTAPTEAPTTEPTEAPTEEPHSEFYAKGVSEDQIIAHFNKVVLGIESNAGASETSLVQKWENPISYRIEGMPSRQDAQTLNKLTKQLNTIEGFPGIQAAKALEQNLTIYFLKDADYKTQFSHVMDEESKYGIVQMWCNDSNGIYSGRIGYHQEASQELRDLLIPEKLVEMLGISEVTVQKEITTDLKPKTIIDLSDLDWSVIKLLYNPRIHNGMNADECEMIIRELYY
ncbi:MAG: DUF2927 domain-containing protein [Oscillospiraceae bacterium]|nr:DUF2927 domain-containing protein [Oscillospiraceae bacterium]